jgi:hypothetical protein
VTPFSARGTVAGALATGIRAAEEIYVPQSNQTPLLSEAKRRILQLRQQEPCAEKSRCPLFLRAAEEILHQK